MSRENRLIHRIHALMLTEPDRWWSYEEIARLLCSKWKIVSSRCIELQKMGKIKKILIGSGKPRGRTARVSIRHDGAYPSWLVPTGFVNIQTVGVTRHVAPEDDDEDDELDDDVQ